MIIPIDDADLNPAALPVILQQIQILQHPNVLFLFSAQEKSLRSMVYISQLELNTNRTDTQPVVNFGDLIHRKLRDVEDIRIDTTNRIEKILPRKYRVRIQPLSPTERLNFKPLVKSKQSKNNAIADGQDKGVPSFIELLEKIPVDIFGDLRSENLAQFFDLGQSFKRRPISEAETCTKLCILPTPDTFATEGIHSFCKIYQSLKIHSDISHPSHPWKSHCLHYNTESKKEYNESEKNEINLSVKKLAEKLNFSLPIPSCYADMLPKYPRTMEQVYRILNRWVMSIASAKDKLKKVEDALSTKKGAGTATKEDGQAVVDAEKKLRENVAQSVKTLLTTCLGYIPQLPHAFERRIKFIDNPNTASKHPILIDFETDVLKNSIEVSGEGIAINAKASRLLSIHSIANHFMHIPVPTVPTEQNSEKVKTKHGIPNMWKTLTRKDAERELETKLIRVPSAYFAAYNLAYDLTATYGVFGRTISSYRYQMRDDTPVSIFSVYADTSLFMDCYCAMPRWYRITDYQLFALAWNDLVQRVENIKKELKLGEAMPDDHVISNWVVLSLLRIHICLEMNYSPFVVTDKEEELIIKAIRKEDATKYDERLDYYSGNPQNFGQLMGMIKCFVQDGLKSLECRSKPRIDGFGAMEGRKNAYVFYTFPVHPNCQCWF